uniref:Uncharacterized protein n=1 Tax=Setaria italica TaxID=4555 RepID=K3YFH9_SETIT
MGGRCSQNSPRVCSSSSLSILYILNFLRNDCKSCSNIHGTGKKEFHGYCCRTRNHFLYSKY